MTNTKRIQLVGNESPEGTTITSRDVKDTAKYSQGN